MLPEVANDVVVGPVTFVHASRIVGHPLGLGRGNALTEFAWENVGRALAERSAAWIAVIDVEGCHPNRSTEIADLAVDVAITAIQLLVPVVYSRLMARITARTAPTWRGNLSVTYGEVSPGIENNLPALGLTGAAFNEMTSHGQTVLDAAGRRLATFVTGQGPLPSIDQAWCDAAYWFHEGLAEPLDTIAAAKLETAVEVLLRSTSSKGSGKRMRQAIEAVTGFMPKDPISPGSAVNVEQFCKSLVGARSQVLHGTFSTLRPNSPLNDQALPALRTYYSRPSRSRSRHLLSPPRPRMTSRLYFVGSVPRERRRPTRRLRQPRPEKCTVVITTLADLLGELARAEAEKLGKSDIKHPTLIGGMYEGLTRELLVRCVPDGLDLQIVGGLVVDGRGGTSGQIDCMLVRGIGTPVPYSPGIYQWHVKDVLAVFEVKKNLFAGDLSDAYLHLRDVLAAYSGWIQNATGETTLNLRPTFRSYAQTMGEVAPPGDQWRNMPMDKHLILHTMMADQLAPLRIILGYEGYSTERGLRKGLLTYLGENLNAPGFGPPSLPNLVVAKGVSLVKLSGHPYHARRKPNGRWPIMASSHLNPLLLILELLWTRLSYDHPMAPLFGEDLDVEALAPLLDAEPAQSAASPSVWGWRYYSHDLTTRQLAAGPNRDAWSPVELDATQFVILNQLCREDVDADAPEFRSFVAGEGLDAEAFIHGLIATTLVAWNGRMLTLTTDECACVLLPDGRRMAGENNTGRLTRWTNRFMEKRRSEAPTS